MEEKGLTKSNVKKLFSWEGMGNEGFWIVFWILVLFSAWAYDRDTSLAREFMQDPCSLCISIRGQANTSMMRYTINISELDNLIIKNLTEENETEDG